MKELKLLSLLTLITGISLFCSTSYSQTSGVGSGAGYTIRVNSNLSRPYAVGDNTQLNVTATTSTFNPPFSTGYVSHLWVTLGRPTIGDLPRSSNSTLEIFLPDGETSLQLSASGFGNINTSPANMVGRSLFFTACIDLNSAFEPDPNGDLCHSDSVLVHPDRPNFLESPARQDPDQATIYWERLPLDNGQRVGSGHRLTLTNQNNPNDQVIVDIVDGDDTGTFNNQISNRLILNNTPIGPLNGDSFVAQLGQAYEAIIQACAPDFSTIGINPLACGEGISRSNVTRFAESSELFTASEGSFASSIEVHWVQHAPRSNTPVYRLIRCEVNTDQCIPRIVAGENGESDLLLSFIDEFEIVPETLYQYTIEACLNEQCTQTVPTGITNAGFASLLQPDNFEVDNNPLQLGSVPGQIINEGGIQQPRTFHEAIDQDWVKIILGLESQQLEISTGAPVGGVNTQLTLFDSNHQIFACAFNIPNVLTPQSQLILPDLPAGEYFLRVEQQDEGQSLTNVPAYELNIDILPVSNSDPVQHNGDFIPCEDLVEGFPGSRNSSPVVTPIIKLLLDE